MSIKNKKILLVNPKYDHVPISCAHIITVLIDHNIEYEFFDMQFNDNLEEKIASDEYYAVGLGGLVLNYSTIEGLLNKIKKANPEIITIVGGRILGMPKEFLSKLKVDFLIQNDAKPALVDLLRALQSGDTNFQDIKGIAYRDNQELIYTEPAPTFPLDGFVPTWKDIELQTYLDEQDLGNRMYRSYSLILGMGCVGKCVFCAPQVASFRLRKVDSIIKELKEVVSKYKIETISIRSEVFYLTVEEAKEFRDAYLASGINKPLIAMIRADIDPDILQYMAEAGCQSIFIGLEAYHNDALKKMGKGISTNDIDITINKAKKLDVQQFSGFLIGNPGDTAESIDATADYFVNNKVCCSTIGPNGVIIFPGTASYRIAVKRNLITDEDKYVRSLCRNEPQARLTTDYGIGKLYPNITTLDDDELWKAYSRSYSKLYRNHLEHFSSKNFDWKNRTTICYNCGETIHVNKAPVHMYPCSKCLASNFLFMHTVQLRQSKKSESIADLIKSNKKIALTGTFNSIYALLDIAKINNKNTDDLLLVCDGNVKNHFEAAFENINCISFSEISEYDIDAFIHYGLHSPECIENEVIKECGITKQKILNATPEVFKQAHEFNIGSQFFYFEYTFEQDLYAFGELLGKMLNEEYGDACKWFLPSIDKYAKYINRGIEHSLGVTDVDRDSASGVIITTPKIQDALALKNKLLKETNLSGENILTLKGDIYKKLWNEIFIKE